MGNLRSVEKACEFLGYSVSIQSDLKGATKVILPGVGAFGVAMDHLAPMRFELRKWADDGLPLMGICLGQQLLFEWSEEFGRHEGLGILEGGVRAIPAWLGLKVPHMGWTPVEATKDSPMFEGIADRSPMYFVHSLYTECAHESNVCGVSEYGIKFAAAIQVGAVWATQFHPEKSGSAGLRILENFLKCS